MSATRIRATSAALVISVAACSGSQQSTALADYGRELEVSVAAMDTAIESANRTAEAGVPSLEKERARIEGFEAAIEGFLEALTSLDPPEAFEALHARAIIVIGDLRDVTVTLGQALDSATTIDEWSDILQGPIGEELREADQRSVELCLQVQDFFDSGVGRAANFASPWLRTSTQQPVDIDLGCPVTS